MQRSDSCVQPPSKAYTVQSSANRLRNFFYLRVIPFKNRDKPLRITGLDSLAFHAMLCVSSMMSVARNVSFLVFFTFCVFNRWSYLKDLILSAPSYRWNLHHHCHFFLPSEAFFRLEVSSHQVLQIFCYVLGTERKKSIFFSQLVIKSQYSRFQCSLAMCPTDFKCLK